MTLENQILRGKIALITGSSSGVGAAAAKIFAREGASVVVNYNNTERGASEVVESIAASGGRAIKIKADVSDKEQVSVMFKKIRDEFGKLDILVNNAGAHNRVNSYREIDEEMWDRLVAVNLKSAWLCSREAAEIMVAQKSGVMINVTSMTNIMGLGANTAYAAAKAGQVTLTRSFARQLAPHIRVNCVGLGIVETRMISDMSEERKEYLKSIKLLKRFARPEEIANVMLFLVSDQSSYITGQTIIADGGEFTISP
ncbi:MAG: SDR family NAD(P)-dependent oxidoreductase [Nitrososphaerales archaeon]